MTRSGSSSNDVPAADAGALRTFSLVSRPRPLGTYLLAGIVVVLVVFLLAAAVLAVTAVHRTEALARAGAGAQATLAARIVDAAVTQAATTVGASAGNPAVSAELARPVSRSRCGLEFALDPFAGARIDIVAASGRVRCSSANSVVDDGPAPWLDAAQAHGLSVSAPYIDRAAGLSVAVSTPFVGSTGRVAGWLVAVLPVSGLARALALDLGGPQGYRFAIFASGTGQVVSSFGGIGAVTLSAPFGRRSMLSGSQRLPMLGWTLVAGRPTGSALANIRDAIESELELGAGCLLVLLAFVAVVIRRITQPLTRLTAAVSRAERHPAEAFANVGGPAEVRRLAGEFQRMTVARLAYEAQLHDIALHDPLTGLPNRALLDDRLRHALASRREHEGVAVLFVDIDRFKLVNDSFGHTAGDQALVVIAGRIGRCIRPSDSLARFGGDEFVVVCEGLVDVAEAERLAERLRAAIAEPLEVSKTIVALSASVGIAVGWSGTSVESLLREADAAMYEAKDLGRSRHHVYDEVLRARATNRLVVENELRHAIDRGELWLAYQPIFDLASRGLVGVESLLRWDHPGLGSVPPAVFVPVAEDSGLIGSLGLFVLEEACRQLRQWRDLGLDLRVSVNLSGRQLTDPSLPGEVRAVLARHALEPDRLCLELTESVLIVDAGTTARTLDELKRIGVCISIDDFGTGYSSLAYLHQFPFDELKIDGAFVSKVVTDPGTHDLVVAMLAMARALDLRVVAEGVESPLQLAQLEEMRCDLAQGFLLGRPGRADAISELASKVAEGVARR